MKNMYEKLGPENGISYGQPNKKYEPIKMPPSEKKKTHPVKNEKRGQEITRRDFTKLIGAGALTIAFGGGAYNLAKKIAEAVKEDDKKTGLSADGIQTRNKSLLEADDQREDEIEEADDDNEVKRDEAMHIEEIVNFRKDRIELNLDTAEAIKNNWKNRHAPGGNLHKSFRDAFYEMGEWMFGFYDKGEWKPGLVEIFRDKGFANDLEFRLDNGKTVKCSKFIFLAIPESYWHTGAKSSAGANGPYQFIRSTGKNRDLRIDNVIDERMDPMASARACADELADLIKKTKDENTALSGYNGGFIWEYLSKTKQEGSKLEYAGFVEFLETKLNNLLDITKNHRDIEHKISKNETIERIAKNYGVSARQILHYNNLKFNQSLKEKSIIKIPLANSIRENVFNYRVRGFSENLNYPPKFNAIIELIKEGAVTTMKAPVKYREVIVKQTPVKEKLYSVRSGDNINKIARVLKTNPRNIVKANPGLTKIRPGMTLKIPGKEVKLINLPVLAEKYGMSLEDIKQLNPKFVPHFDKQSGKEKYYPIPNNEKIRIKAYV